MNDQIHLTEDEQVEQLKKWWKENGTSIIVGIVIGLGAVIGYWQWVKYQDQRSHAASVEYDTFADALAEEKDEVAATALASLKTEYKGTTYAALAALMMAADQIKDKKPDEAIETLKWAYEHAGHDSVKHLARIRLARLYVNQKQYTEALVLVDNVKEPAFDARYSVIKADVYSKQGKLEKAKAEYESALASNTLAGKQREYVQMKLADLGLGSTSEVSGK